SGAGTVCAPERQTNKTIMDNGQTIPGRVRRFLTRISLSSRMEVQVRVRGKSEDCSFSVRRRVSCLENRQGWGAALEGVHGWRPAPRRAGRWFFHLGFAARLEAPLQGKSKRLTSDS